MTSPNIFKRTKRKLRAIKRKSMAPVARGIVSAKLDNLAAYLGLFTPKVVKCIDGGLASQMLMLAQGYHYSKERELPLYLDIDWFKRSGKDINGNRNRPFHLFDAFPEVRKKYSDKIVHRSVSIKPATL